MENDRTKSKKDIQNRLRRIEGQVKGIEKMVQNDNCCREILIQVAAIRAAINKVGSMILENYAKQCFCSEDSKYSEDEKISELVDTLNMFLK